MPFWKCYYHIVWATKNREPLISPAVEVVISNAIRSKSHELRCPILAVNGIADHIHVAVSIRPTLAIGDWVGQVKGASSCEVNLTFPDLETRFRWQSEYGVLTLGAKNLPFVISYIENQKDHHRQDDLQPYLEQSAE
ncbi:MAG: IS200/IS605 family transposase [Anaerolineae bacterium]|nr:IS200/IS605 family transposase [Anaerolineae bacterium]